MNIDIHGYIMDIHIHGKPENREQLSGFSSREITRGRMGKMPECCLFRTRTYESTTDTTFVGYFRPSG